jgi:hypothetical protein
VGKASSELADIDGDGNGDALVGEYYGYTVFCANAPAQTWLPQAVRGGLAVWAEAV